MTNNTYLYDYNFFFFLVERLFLQGEIARSEITWSTPMNIFTALKCVAKWLASKVAPNARRLLKVRLILIPDQHMCNIKLTIYQLGGN